MNEAQRSSVFVFADIAGFTALTEIHGDEDAADLVAEFATDVDERIPVGGGEIVKIIGDALMLRLDEPAAAVELGLCLVGDLMREHGRPQVRVGMHCGGAVQRGNDWFGSTVNIAARISGLAGGGDVLLTDAVRENLGELPGVVLHRCGQERLRNVRAALDVYCARRQGQAKPDLVVDPVCRMSVARDRAVAQVVHEGVEYRFCSLDCVGAFAAAPDRYVTGSRNHA